MRVAVLIWILTAMVLSLSADISSVRSDEWTSLKQGFSILDRHQNEFCRAQTGEGYEEDLYLTEFGDYLEDILLNNADCLTKKEKDSIFSIISDIEKKMPKALSEQKSDQREVWFLEICGQTDIIINDILSVPETSEEIAVARAREMVAVVTVGTAYMRTGPGKDYDQVCSVKQGARLPVSDEENTWYKVTSPGGRVGWISGKCVRIEGSGSDTGTDDEDNGSNGNNSDGDSDNSGSGDVESILSSAKGAIGQSGTLYGYQVYNADTNWGRVACCAVVSSILIHADAIPSSYYELYCPTMKAKLRDELDWNVYTGHSFQKGDVIFWRKSTSGSYENKREKHIGIVYGKDKAGKWLTVDNSSSRKEVVKRALFRPKTYPVAGPGARK